MLRAVTTAIIAVFGAMAGWAQTSAQASIILTARVPSSVTLSVDSQPVSLSIKASDQPTANVEFPLRVKWNLNPAEVQGFEIVAYFADPSSPLINELQPVSLPVPSLLARLGTGDFRPFNSAGRASLTTITVAAEGRQGQRSQVFQLKNSNQAAVPDGEYHGVVYFEVRQY